MEKPFDTRKIAKNTTDVSIVNLLCKNVQLVWPGITRVVDVITKSENITDTLTAIQECIMFISIL